MKAERHTYLHLELHSDEVEKLVLMLNEVTSTMSNAPDWAKARAAELLKKIEALGF